MKYLEVLAIFFGSGGVVLVGFIQMNPWIFTPGLIVHVWAGKALGLDREPTTK